MTYNYVAPPATCVADPIRLRQHQPAVPHRSDQHAAAPDSGYVEFNTGSATIQDQVLYTAFYAQDQWTMKRFTVSGALRYDHAASAYGETCIGPDP